MGTMRLRFAKNKKLMITAIVLSVLFILGDAGVLFLSQEKFGHIPQGKRLERIKQSPNYDGKQFVNEVETVTMTGDRSVFAVWKDFLFGDKSQTVPDTAMNVVKTDLKSLPQDRDWIVWFGHSSYLLNLSGKKVLVDPVFYQGSPVSFVNKMFKGTDIYKPADMPDIDYLVITHDHWDHLDYQVVTELEPRVKRVVTGLGVGEHFEYWKYPVEKLTELDWWDSADLGEGFNVTATPARHFSGRDLHQNKTLWASFAFKSPKRTVWIGTRLCGRLSPSSLLNAPFGLAAIRVTVRTSRKSERNLPTSIWRFLKTGNITRTGRSSTPCRNTWARKWWNSARTAT